MVTTCKKDSDKTDDLTYSESLVPEGHPTHPLTKTKLPLTMEEVRAYAPEFEKRNPLQIMMIEKTMLCAQLWMVMINLLLMK